MPYIDDFNSKAFDHAWGDDKEETAYHDEDDIRDSREESTKHFEAVIANVHPDSFMGYMMALKRSLNVLNAELLPLQNEAVANKIGEIDGANHD